MARKVIAAAPVDRAADDRVARLPSRPAAISPVTSDSSMLRCARVMTSPSTGTLSPGRSTTMSPTTISAVGDLDLPAVAQHGRGWRHQVEEGAQGIGGPLAALHLHPVAEEDEGDEHRRRLEEDLLAADDHQHHAGDIGGQHAGGDQHAHVERAAAQRLVGAADEDPAGPEDDRRREQQHDPVGRAAGVGRSTPKRLLPEGRVEHGRDGQQQRDEEAVAHVALHRRRHRRVAHVVRHAAVSRRGPRRDPFVVHVVYMRRMVDRVRGHAVGGVLTFPLFWRVSVMLLRFQPSVRYSVRGMVHISYLSRPHRPTHLAQCELSMCSAESEPSPLWDTPVGYSYFLPYTPAAMTSTGTAGTVGPVAARHASPSPTGRKQWRTQTLGSASRSSGTRGPMRRAQVSALLPAIIRGRQFDAPRIGLQPCFIQIGRVGPAGGLPEGNL